MGRSWGDVERTWIFPLQAVWVEEIGTVTVKSDGEAVGFFDGAVFGDEIISSPSWICDDCMGGDEGRSKEAYEGCCEGR